LGLKSSVNQVLISTQNCLGFPQNSFVSISCGRAILPGAITHASAFPLLPPHDSYRPRNACRPRNFRNCLKPKSRAADRWVTSAQAQAMERTPTGNPSPAPMRRKRPKALAPPMSARSSSLQREASMAKPDSRPTPVLEEFRSDIPSHCGKRGLALPFPRLLKPEVP